MRSFVYFGIRLIEPVRTGPGRQLEPAALALARGVGLTLGPVRPRRGSYLEEVMRECDLRLMLHTGKEGACSFGGPEHVAQVRALVGRLLEADEVDQVMVMMTAITGDAAAAEPPAEPLALAQSYSRFCAEPSLAGRLFFIWDDSRLPPGQGLATLAAQAS